MVTFNRYCSAVYRLPKYNCIAPLRFYSDSDEDEAKTNKKEESELPEAPTTCCMSGCANCVWVEYAEKVTKYFRDGGEKAMKEIDEKVQDPNIKAFILQELRERNSDT